MSLSIIIAKLIVGRHMETASEEVKKAWRTILIELDPSPKIKRRKVS
jgi:hypothetical protein